LHHPAFRAASLLVLVAYVGACTGWQMQSAAPAQTLADPQYATKTVRLTTEQQGHVYLSHPTVTGDSVSGRQGAAPAIFALTDVKEVATEQPKTTNTVLLVSGTVIGWRASPVSSTSTATTPIEHLSPLVAV
jgi:hypothetical protein